MKLILRLLVSAAAFWVAAELLAVDGPLSGLIGAGNGIVLAEERFSTAWFFTLLVVAVIFGVVNAVLQQLIKTLGCALYVATLGLVALLVNGLLLLLSSWIANSLLNLDFRLEGTTAGIVWTAVLGALIIGIVSWLLNIFLRTRT
jgi:putative membrane protein